MRNIFSKALVLVLALTLLVGQGNLVAFAEGEDAVVEPDKCVCVAHTNEDARIGTTDGDCVTDATATYKCATCEKNYTIVTKTAPGHVPAVLEAVEPTCTETGLTEGEYCSVCEEILVEQIEIPAHDHSPETIPGVDATCTEAGLTEGVYCPVCEETLVEQEEIPALEHTVVEIPALEPTCFEDGHTAYSYCSVCEEEIVAKEVITTIGHNYEMNEEAPDCWAAGTVTFTCKKCGHTISEEGAEAQHDYEIIDQWEGNCRVNGGIDYECTRCGAYDWEDLGRPFEHKFDLVVDKAATCDENGYHRVYCSYECEVDREDNFHNGYTHCYHYAGDGCGRYDECADQAALSYVIPALGHDYTVEVVFEGNCEEGTYKALKCSRCDEMEFVEWVVEPTEHSIVVDEAVEPDCTETGLTEGEHCENCDYCVEQEVIEALGHTEVVDEAVEPGCTKTGLTEGSHCSVCEEVLVAQEEIAALGHNAGETLGAVLPNCYAPGFVISQCTVCETTIRTYPEELAQLEHIIVPVEGVDATCTETGLTKGEYCSREECDYCVEQEVIEALGHTEVVDEAVEPTCTETGLTEGSHCSVCEEVLVEQEEVAALGHTEEEVEAVEATCTEVGYTAGVYCTVCEEIIDGCEEIPALGHDYEEYIGWDATCTEDGRESGERCNACGNMTGAIIPSPGHDRIVVPGKAATCTEFGVTDGEMCSACETVFVAQELIDKLDHTIEVDEAVEATCTEAGVTEGEHCSVCGEVFVAQEEIPALGHVAVEVPAVDPTYDSVGYTAGWQCTVCEEYTDGHEEIPALDEEINFTYDIVGINGADVAVNSGSIFVNVTLNVTSEFARLRGVDFAVAFNNNYMSLVTVDGYMLDMFNSTPVDIANNSGLVKLGANKAFGVETEKFAKGEYLFATLEFKVNANAIGQFVFATDFDNTEISRDTNLINDVVVDAEIDASIECVKLGDIYVDGKLSTKDVNAFYEWASNEENVGGYLAVLDMNKDGSVTFEDYAILLDAVVGNEDYLNY